MQHQQIYQRRDEQLDAVGSMRDAASIAAGRELAALLQQYRGSRALVLALPRGGIPVATEVARALRLPVEVLVACAFSVPWYPRIVAGAVSEGGGLCLNGAVLRLPGVSADDLWCAARRAHAEVARQVAVYRRGRPLPNCHRRPIILVDDGLGSGLVQLAALQALHSLHAQQCVVATPWGTPAAIQRVARRAEVVVAHVLDRDEPLDDAACPLDLLEVDAEEAAWKMRDDDDDT